MKIKKADLLDPLIIALMFLQLTVLGFFGFTAPMNKVVALLILFRCFLDFRITKKEFLLGGAVLALFALSALSGERSLSRISSNFMILFYPMVYLYYGVYLCIYREKLIDRIFDKGFWVFNGVMIVNTIAMLIQIHFPYSIQAKVVFFEIDYYKDTISGFFAYASTHVVCLYCIFVILYNLALSRSCTGKRKYALLGYTALLTAVNCYISQNNDNKAFFMLLPIFLVVYFLLDLSSTRDKMKKALLYGSALLAVFLAAYWLAPPFTRFIDKSIIGVLRKFFSQFNAGPEAVGGAERTALIGYAIKIPETWLFGQGIGSNGLHQSSFHGFQHFGQNSLGSTLLLLGFWFYCAMLLWITALGTYIVRGSCGKKIPAVFVCALASAFVVLTLYTQLFSSINVIFCVILILFALRTKVRSMG